MIWLLRICGWFLAKLFNVFFFATALHTIQSPETSLEWCQLTDVCNIRNQNFFQENHIELEFRVGLEAIIMTLFYQKIQIYYINFSSIFCRNCQIQCFWTLSLLFQWVEIFELWFDAKTSLHDFNLFGIAATVCKK